MLQINLKNMNNKLKSIIAALPLVVLASCGNQETESHADHNTTVNTSTTNSSKKVLEADLVDGKQLVTLMAGDDMKYNAKEIKVKANTPLVLTLKHTGKMPLKSMGHNVVILTQEAIVADFINAANAATQTDYIPQEKKSEIIAHTKMLGGGESDEITFTFTQPGTYPYLCSFPGHSMIMKGKFIVE